MLQEMDNNNALVESEQAFMLAHSSAIRPQLVVVFPNNSSSLLVADLCMSVCQLSIDYLMECPMKHLLNYLRNLLLSCPIYGRP